MKTQIIHCESFDDLRSLLDRLRWIKARRAVLVMPEKDPPVLSKLELALLKRKAQALHIELGFVSNDGQVQRMIQQAGLPLFENIEESRQNEWKYFRPVDPVVHRQSAKDQLLHFTRTDDPKFPAVFGWLAVSLSALAILFLMAALFPGAQVELNLPRRDQSGEMTVTAGFDLSSPDLIAGIPLYRTSLKVSATISQKTSGFVTVGDDAASGLVKFTNLTDQEVTIPTGAVVRSLEPACRFMVIQPGSLPPGPGSTITLRVEEMDGSGAGGNVEAGTILAADPPLGLSVSVTNPQAMTGGTFTRSLALAQADMLSSETAIAAALKQAFLVQAPAVIPDQAVLIEGSIWQETILVSSTPPPFDRPISSFEVSQTVELVGAYFLRDELDQWAALALDASKIPGQIALPGSLDVVVKSVDISQKDGTHITIQTSRQTIPSFDPQFIATSLRWLEAGEAEDLIRSTLIPGSQPIVSINPPWWPRLPFIPMRITVNG